MLGLDMKKRLGILFLGLLWCNVGFAGDEGGIREPGTDERCFYVYEKENIFKKKFLPKVNKDKGIFVTYVGCNKYYDDWSYDYSLAADIDEAHERAYYGCVGNEMPQYNLTGCHLFSINDVIVWGKDAAFVAKVEKETKKKKIVEKPKKKKTVKKLKFNEPTTNPFDKKKKKPLPTGSFVYSNALDTDDIFSKRDPTTFKKLTFKKERSVRVKDNIWSSGKSNMKPRNMRVFNFIAEYEENIKVKIFIEYNHKDKKISKENQKLIAEKKALYFSRMFGQMPYFLKIYTKKIYVYRNDGKIRPWWVPWKLSGQAWVLASEFHLAEARCGSYYYKEGGGHYHECAKTMIHELAHVVNYKTKLINPSKWLKARKLDKNYCSSYAKTNSVEDFAESVVCWIGVRYKSHKMNSRFGNVKKINRFIPNRLKFFDELNLKVHPIK